MIEVLLGIGIGLFLAFFLGHLCTKKIYNEEVFGSGFCHGFAYGKDSFCNPSAEG